MTANDNPSPEPETRLIPLIGEVHDDGQVERYDVIELLKIPAELLRRGAVQSCWRRGRT